MRAKVEAKLEKLRAQRLELDQQIREAAAELAATDTPEPESSMSGILSYVKRQAERRAAVAQERAEQSDFARKLKEALAAKREQDKAKRGDADSA